eukprot:scaffold35922_cov65-Phaeocystis_antarctica.AAC.2
MENSPPLCCILEAHRDAGHHLCRHLRAQFSRRRPRRLVDDVQGNRLDDRVSRLLLRLLARRRRRRCSLLRRRRPPFWCSGDTQRRLLGGDEVAQVHTLATAPHLHLVGLGPPAALVEPHAEVARLALGHGQRQPLRLRLLPRLLARQRRGRWWCRCSPLPRRLHLRRPREAKRRLLGGGEAAKPVVLAATRSVSPSACACCRTSSLVNRGAAAALAAAACPSGDCTTCSAASSAVAKRPSVTILPPRHTRAANLLVTLYTPKYPVVLSATTSVSPSACACCRASSLVSGGAAAAFCAAACPSGDRATHSAASSAVAKQPKCMSLPPRLTCVW